MDKPVTLIIGLGQTVGDAVARRFLDEGHAVLAVDPDAPTLSGRLTVPPPWQLQTLWAP